MIFAPADMTSEDVRDLLRLHIEEARQDECTAAFDEARLLESDVDLFALRGEGGALLGIAALKTLSGGAAEVKSVRTHPDHLRRGVAHCLMDGIEAEARARGLTTILLQTHPTDAYLAARRLYAARGYVRCGAFGDYPDDDHSVFMAFSL